MINIKEITSYLDDFLRIRDIEDKSYNGLQVENSGSVRKVALAVDASIEAFQKCIDMNANLLFVHHGLFWDEPVSVTGAIYERVKILIEADIALYAAHLPLDMHPEVGNNSMIEEVLNWPVKGDFGEYHGSVIGRSVEFEEPVSMKTLMMNIQEKLQCEPVSWEFGRKKIKRLGYVSGGGIGLLKQAISDGMDAFVTGEPGHTYFWMAKEAGINVIFAGHYCTETLGVKAVGDVIQKKWGLETVFIDLPTGL